ncbi:hypothetical protein [Methylibium sp.]|uniref:hypothetical protein n=1 Tax=Methylibium sp. TaxID=2067992 RepID=UPI00182D951C|nr:hypothetical protein [Methylibium sp.]MBA3589663.1 hypothetical protein [Methylibium sp.]
MSTETKPQTTHTPGPWAAAHFPSETENRYCIRGAGDFFCTVDSRAPRLVREMQSNARLIAAAPDMLDALRLALDYCESGAVDDSIPGTLSETIRDAIAAATGATP